MALLMPVAVYVLRDEAVQSLRTLLRWNTSPAKQITLTETLLSLQDI